LIPPARDDALGIKLGDPTLGHIRPTTVNVGLQLRELA
jgi:hypothetical protein